MSTSARRRMREGFVAGQISIDGLDDLQPPAATADDEQAQVLFAAHAQALHLTHLEAHPDPWIGSRYEWVRRLAPARRGKVAAELVSVWLRAAGVDVARRATAGHDRVLDGLRAQIKMSTLWTGQPADYTFQQIRDREFDILVLLGISPEAVHLWVLPKDLALTHVSTNGWLTVNPVNPAAWLHPHGGPLPAALTSLHELTSDDEQAS